MSRWWICGSGGRRPAISSNGCRSNPHCVGPGEGKHLSSAQARAIISASFPKLPPPERQQAADKPKVAILRDEGSNSDREMSSAFYLAGFEVWDISMTDLLEERVRLDDFRGLAAVGGFSYADVPESAKGWAATIRFNDRLREQFDTFYQRPDTFSLGICNGCQLFGLIGWVPWTGLEAAASAPVCPQHIGPLRIPLDHGQGQQESGDHARGHGGAGLRHSCGPW